MPTIAEQLSDYALSLRFEDLPGEIVHQAKRMIIDTHRLCSWAATTASPASIARGPGRRP